MWTAELVRKARRTPCANLGVLAEWDVDQYLILSGDHLYRMNYADFIRYHRGTSRHHPRGRAGGRRGVGLRLAADRHPGARAGFSEKPTGAALHAMQVDTTVLGLSAAQAQAAPYIASMGIYVFDKPALHELLTGSCTWILAKTSSAGGERAQCAGVSVPGLLGRYRDDRGLLPRQSGAHRAAGAPVQLL